MRCIFLCIQVHGNVSVLCGVTADVETVVLAHVSGYLAHDDGAEDAMEQWKEATVGTKANSG